MKIAEMSMKKVALLGTKFTMEKDFYKAYIFNRFGIEVIIPTLNELEIIHNTIYNELVQGVIKDESRLKFQQIIGNLEKRGVEGVILDCTEFQY